MSLNEYGRQGGRRGYRATPRRFLPALLIMILLIPAQGVRAVGPLVSGSTQMGNSLEYGTTLYSVDYQYPSTVQVGSNLSIALTLHVVAMTGIVEYAAEQRIIVHVFLASQAPLNGSIITPSGAEYLYPGSTWGPNNVTIPLTESNTGLAKGASVNASVSITLQDEVWYGVPLSFITTEPAMEGQGGSLIIQNQVPSNNGSASGGSTFQTYLPYALLASGAVLMLFAVVLPRGPRSPPANQK